MFLTEICRADRAFLDRSQRVVENRVIRLWFRPPGTRSWSRAAARPRSLCSRTCPASLERTRCFSEETSTRTGIDIHLSAPPWPSPHRTAQRRTLSPQSTGFHRQVILVGADWGELSTDWVHSVG